MRLLSSVILLPMSNRSSNPSMSELLMEPMELLSIQPDNPDRRGRTAPYV